MIPIIGRLYRRNVVTYCYGRALHNQSVLEIMRTHRFVRQVAHNELSEFESFPILESLDELEIGPSHIDIGKLATKFMELNSSSSISPIDFTRSECEEVIGRHIKPLEVPQDVVLYGFGRVGRLLARLLIEKTGGGDQLRLRGVVVRRQSDDDLHKRASLLRRDSVHGAFPGTIRVDQENESLIINGNVVHFIYSNDPASINYKEYGITNALIIDNTGAWRDEAGLSKHLEAEGAAKVILTAPGKGKIKNIVSGVNSNQVTPNDKILSAASCTTNAIVPVLKAMNDEFH
ncbi:MAG: glyceraldehyde-3-phosphate dehydrogenase, partial [Gammaproteobacteria bacterium]|nr:glyceraldehyde-3-phosphate dehydrogenase [Gammaproteobacteria bacterium]